MKSYSAQQINSLLVHSKKIREIFIPLFKKNLFNDKLIFFFRENFKLPPFTYVAIDMYLRNQTVRRVIYHLFYFGSNIKENELKLLFTKDEIRFFLKIGILEKQDGSNLFRSKVMFTPFKNYFFASDFIFRYLTEGKFEMIEDVENVVYPANFEASFLGYFPIKNKREHENVLDVTTGCGTYAILYSQWSKRVMGIDINERAINYANLNLQLNEIKKNVTFMIGDLYKELPKNVKFDCILAYPPGHPVVQTAPSFQNGGKTGNDVLKRVIQDLPDYLSSSGVAQIECYLTIGKSESVNTLLKSWIRNNKISILVDFIRKINIDEYSIRFARYNELIDVSQYLNKVRSTLQHLENMQIKEIDHVVFYLKWGKQFDITKIQHSENIKTSLFSLKKIDNFLHQ